LRWWHAQAPTERFVLRTNSLLAQQEAARAGWGIALAPCHLLAGDTRLVRVLPRVQVPSLDLWLVCHEDVRQSGRVKATYEALAELLAAERAALGGTP
jgi:DNA-binding transcriptional LysR family regulator